MSDEITVRDGVPFKCPGCGKTCIASSEHCMVLHEEPRCAEFDKREALEFLEWVNQRNRN